ncbi:MAG: hypothetical protein UT66_C0045G0005 [candidate division CPR2 bacterium GW2011_GWC1_39_9]|nr:MAG: hypothetical protein UT66_C0045G0005 [candidate division CPR2 bacterium GW2011_GWC1_39_9]
MKIIKQIDVEKVISFFKRINKNPGNDALTVTIKKFPVWYLVMLEAYEFDYLECQTDPHSLLKDLDFKKYYRERSDIKEKLDKLRAGRKLAPIIIREKYSNDMSEASFYLEDGTGKSIAHKIFFAEKKPATIFAYLGVFSDFGLINQSK